MGYPRIPPLVFTLLLAGLAWPAQAGNLDLYLSTIRLVRDRYLFVESMSADNMVRGAVDELTGDVEWLMADFDGNHVRLHHGDGAPIGEITVEGLDLLPQNLAALEDMIRSAPYPLDPDLDLEVEILRGAIRSLDHPSVILAGERLQSFDERLKGTLDGIGARLSKENDDIVVTGIFPDSPAEEGDLREGDVLLRIDGVSTLGMSVDDAGDRIRGAEGTDVGIQVRRGNQVLRLSFVRAAVRIPNLDTRILDSGVGFVSISHFSEQTVDNLRMALADLGSRGALERGLIIDLRGNTGGSLIQAARCADQFLVEGNLVSTVGRDGASVSNLVQEMYADDEGTEPPVPIVVLVDRQTASGSEILAGALSLLDRAIMLGQRTYGKGTVQKVFNLRSDLRLKLTVAQYLLVGDVSVAEKGLDPDIPTGATIFDRNGVRPGDADANTLLFVEERSGWRAGDTVLPKAVDPEVLLAERILLQCRGPHRDDALQAARAVTQQLRAEQEDLLIRTYALAAVDWAPAPAPGPQPQVKVTLETDGPPKAGKPTVVRARVENLGGDDLWRVNVKLFSANKTWNGLYLPIGHIPPHGSAEGRHIVPLSPRNVDRIDEVSILIEADGRPEAPPQRTSLRIQGKPAPAIAVAGRLVPDGDRHFHASLEIGNLGSEPLSDVRVRFDFPAMESIELLDPEVVVSSLLPSETQKLDLGLLIREGFDSPILPLELKVDAEGYGALARWDFPLPADGSRLTLQAPKVRIQGAIEAPTDSPFHLSLQAQDDVQVDHVVVYLNGVKRFYKKGTGPTLQMDLDFLPMSGTNEVVAWVTDDRGLQTQGLRVVFGNLADVPSADAEEADQPTP